MPLKGTKEQTQMRLLLKLWVMDGLNVEVNKSDLTKRVRRKDETVEDYKSIYTSLVKQGAIAVTVVKKKPLWEKVKLNEAGLQEVLAGLQDEKFQFDANIGPKTANALLKLLRMKENAASMNGKNGNGKSASFEKLKTVA